MLKLLMLTTMCFSLVFIRRLNKVCLEGIKMDEG